MTNLQISGTITADLSNLTGPQGPKGDPWSPIYYTTCTELAASLDVFNSTKTVVYEIPVGALNLNDLLIVTSQFESTNPLTYNVMLGRYLYLTATEGSFYITRPATCNTTTTMHHQTVNIARTYKITKNLTNAKIQLVAYAAATSATSGVTNTIEPGYGHLDAIRILANSTI